MDLFEKFNISKELLNTIKGMGFAKPTQIQERAIPPILEGKDVVGESATGSGKTFAFGCGIVERLKPKNEVQVIVLTPTRELAEQVKESLKQISFHKKLKIIAVYGGVAIEPQIEQLKTSDVVVATPGRVLDHLERGTIMLSKIKILVLDEADRMFDMGFIDDVEKIIRHCHKQRQTLFFSATISQRVKVLAKKHMISPVIVYARNMVDPAKLKQGYYDIKKNMKIALLVHLLSQQKSGLAMVFCNTRRMTDFIVKNLRVNKINAIAIHGGLSQNKRTKTIGLFNDSKANVLVCTDVAARGLHIENVSVVYNYEVPKDPKDYVHRIGRTARAGEAGKAITILSDYDHDSFSRVQQEYRNFFIEKIKTPFLKRLYAVAISDLRKRRNTRIH